MTDKLPKTAPEAIADEFPQTPSGGPVNYGDLKQHINVENCKLETHSIFIDQAEDEVWTDEDESDQINKTPGRSYQLAEPKKDPNMVFSFWWRLN